MDTKFDDDYTDEDSAIRKVANKAKLRLRIKFNKRKNVEVTLQQMFEGEIDLDNDGFVDVDNQQKSQNDISFQSVESSSTGI